MEKSFVAVDIETTGLSPIKDRIIEIGAVKVIDAKVIEKFSMLIDPQSKLPQRIIELTGITDAMVSKQATIDRAIKAFIEFASDLPLLGHNIIFDYSFLKTAAIKEDFEFERSGIDTLTISRALHDEMESKSLESMCNYYHITNENQHRAYDDAYASMNLYFELAKHIDATDGILRAKPLSYRPKKIEPITARQKNYLLDLLKYHKIELRQSIDSMTKSEASRAIDNILFEYGRKSN